MCLDLLLKMDRSSWPVWKSYNTKKQIRFRLRSDFCDYSDVYIVFERINTVAGEDNKERWKECSIY